MRIRSYRYHLTTGVEKVKTKLAKNLSMVGLLLAGGLITLALPLQAFAFGGDQTNAMQCGGKVIVNVTYTLFNDTDSAVGGGTWANDTINRHLQISQVSDGMFCAMVSDNGSFVTFAGPSPQVTGTVADGVKGVISGGERTTTFAGSLVSDPTYKVKGQLGTFDLMCDRNQNCLGAHPTISNYVTGWDGDLAWWGWEYKTPQNGVWVNAITGNTGDILS